MNDTTLLFLKVISNITLASILCIKDYTDKFRLLARLGFAVLNFIPLGIILNRNRIYKKKYAKRREYKLPRKIHIVFIILNYILQALVAYLSIPEMFSTYKIIILVFHILVNLYFNYELLSIKYGLIGNKKTKNKNQIEYGTINAEHIVNNKTLLRVGEKVQIIMRYHNRVVVRKTDSSELDINVDLIEER